MMICGEFDHAKALARSFFSGCGCFAKSRGFTLAAVIALALGTGANASCCGSMEVPLASWAYSLR